MKHWIRKRFNRYWYSICSAHGKGHYDKSCAQCVTGCWVSERSLRESRKWYREHEFDPASGLFRRKGQTTCDCGICVTARSAT